MPSAAAYTPVFDGTFSLRGTEDSADSTRALTFSLPPTLDGSVKCCLLWEFFFPNDQRTDVELFMEIGETESVSKGIGRFTWPGPPQWGCMHLLVPTDLVRPGANSLSFVAHPTVIQSDGGLVGQTVLVRDVVLWHHITV
ncbi:hypothetical protein [Blastococcus sp. VKM Ac-2987]|uniref:hypothetical protein n=1 Tax=Blastococcus sp. VKM Ac-2987 TaxID=3004141 RepID=UPI0022AB52F6|nr:hypothetical protein [Blastococcus sp. VKM Ac-2987]MCZ2857837.1 hypothetical protein [Blastococcus sp. VKM Ac-2987]